jgi:C-terminal processing protease CtpA/Prc
MQKLLRPAIEAARRDLAEAQKNCDLSPLWENKKSDCSLVVSFAPGPVVYAKPGDFANTVLGSIYFSASRYAYREGVFSGKLVILIDPRTASSSEAFASMLRDNNAATLIGYPSLGAGCGYTNGGIPATLKNSGATARMPDCVRFRADGSNEINGITPDIFVPWRQNDSPFQRAKRVADTLVLLTK